jgi:polyribonucleotide nucleotidyltransferase
MEDASLATRVEIELGGRILSLETGWLAKQADGAVLARYGDTMLLASVVAEKEAKQGSDFLPLVVDYLEKTFAAGKIPGGFFKREGRPTEKEVTTSRLIDRPLRPLFPAGYFMNTQIIATVLSADQENDSDVLAINAASAALQVSDIPFPELLAAVRVGRIDGNLVLNPTQSQINESELNLVVAAKRDAIVMVEGQVRAAPEEEVLKAISFGYQGLQPILDLQERLAAKRGKPKRAFVPVEAEKELEDKIGELWADAILEAAFLTDKQERRQRLASLAEQAVNELAGEDADKGRKVSDLMAELERRLVRQRVLKEGARIDGRRLNEVRPISCQVGVLPRTHGSALFTRGETQVMATATLGTAQDEQKIDGLLGESYKSFLLHYNFPPFCVGEAKFLRGPTRREVGHGVLAERAISPVLPIEDDFPYTIRIVSEVLESNGSSSMATVCGGILSLMDAGVPIKAPVAGVALGLIKEGDQLAILSDILGDEDHLGDMDFKVAGTAEGITALQLDIKTTGITEDILGQALAQAREGRLFVLEEMAKIIAAPRPALSIYAPRIVTIQIKPEKIRELIGPGGKNIRAIIEKTGVRIDVEDSGKVNIASAEGKSLEEAIELIQEITKEAEVGRIYRGKVRKIVDFGAFVEILPGIDGLVHISQLSEERVKKVTDVLKEGEEVLVKVLDIDPQGKIRLSRKEALRERDKGEDQLH